MPTTSPSVVTSGPPELPGLAAASNWIRLVSTRLPSGERYSRFRPDTTPADTDGPMPNGKPTAITSSPEREVARWSACVAAMRSSGIVFACSTARSFSGCSADDGRVGFEAVEERRPGCWSAPATTCRLVRMMPLSTITTPVPTLRSTSSPFSSMPMPRTRTTAGRMSVERLGHARGQGVVLQRAHHRRVDVLLGQLARRPTRLSRGAGQALRSPRRRRQNRARRDAATGSRAGATAS